MKKIVMLGTGLDTMGGIASVVRVYQEAGLLRRYGIRYIATHCDGGKLRKFRAMAGAYVAFLGMLLRGQVGLLHVHVASRASFWRKSGFFALAFAFGIPAILHLHGAEFAQFYGEECGPLRKRIVRGIFDRCRRVVVLSDAWKRWVQGVSKNPHVEAIYNPVLLPPSAVAWTARQPGAVLSLGRLGKRKGSYDLLEAAARVLPSAPAVELRLGGDGELDAVRARAAQLGMADHLNLLGWVNGERKEQQLAGAMLYALPSYNEGLPMSVLEAMAAGLPVLATPVGGIPEAVSDGVEGFLVEPGDVEALAARLAQLLQDEALAQRMGAAARHKVETTFSSQAVLPRVEKMYQELGFAPL
ncbi:glycosyltransferase family 4 protein [Pseudoduganella sp. UC29_106]|uniref:glycosyltransferase family 4 protein n=1 Tax=Pseudoduganella sp. UC29_106 TaxID=3374553 RepID=UPI00375839F6